MQSKASKGGPQKPNPYDLAAPVAQRVEIEAVNLIKSVIRRDVHLDVDSNVEAGFTVNTTVYADSNTIHVFPQFQVASSAKKGGTAPSILVQAEFQLVYSAESLEELAEENFEAFGRLNGIFNCWPYWREYVQQMTTRMGLPALVLPVYRPDRPFTTVRGKKRPSNPKPKKKAKARPKKKGK